MRPDYTVDQVHEAYAEEQHDRWRRLYERQMALVPGRACDEYLVPWRALAYETGIPRFDSVTAPGAATRWQLVASRSRARPRLLRAPRTPALSGHGLDPRGARVRLHRRAGHLPRLLRPRAHAVRPRLRRLHGGVRAGRPQGSRARRPQVAGPALLVHGRVRPRAHPAGAAHLRGGHPLLTGRGRARREQPEAPPLAFDLLRVMRSLYRIDAFQETYFVVEGFRQLFDATAPDFAPLYERLAGLPDVAANAALPGDAPGPARWRRARVARPRSRATVSRRPEATPAAEEAACSRPSPLLLPRRRPQLAGRGPRRSSR